MASKNVIMKRKIANEIFELLPKTSGAQVEVSYGSVVQDLATVLSTVYTDIESWKTFKADVDFGGQDAALDTLRELINYLSDQEVATSIAGQIKAIKERLDAAEATITQHTTDIANNASAIAALTQTVADNKTAADATEAKAEQNKTDIAALTKTVADNKTAAEAAAKTNADAIAANAEAIANIQTVQGKLARVLVQEDVPADLTENDLLMQIVG